MHTLRPLFAVGLILLGTTGNVRAENCAPLPDIIPAASGCLLELGLLTQPPLHGIDLNKGVDISQLKHYYGEPTHAESWRATDSRVQEQEIEFLKLEYNKFKTVLSRPLGSTKSRYKIRSLSISDPDTVLPCDLKFDTPASVFKRVLGAPRESKFDHQVLSHRYHWNHFYCTQQGWKSEEAVIVLFENATGHIKEISWDYFSR